MRLLALIAFLACVAACNQRFTAPPMNSASSSTDQQNNASNSKNILHAEKNSSIDSRLIVRFAGTYDYDELLNTAEIKKALQILLKDDYSHFVENMNQLRTPIDVINRDLVLRGNRNDTPVREEAILCISPSPLRVHVGIYSDNAMTIYSTEKAYHHLPSGLLQWIFLQTSDTTAMTAPPKQGESEFNFQYKVMSKK